MKLGNIKSKRDRNAIKILIKHLSEVLGDRLVKVVLFGSKARGDDNQDSDIDVLVLVKTDTWEIKDQILTIGSRISLEQDVIFNLFVRPQERWDYMASIRYPLWRSIISEGIDLTPELAAV